MGSPLPVAKSVQPIFQNHAVYFVTLGNKHAGFRQMANAQQAREAKYVWHPFSVGRAISVLSQGHQASLHCHAPYSTSACANKGRKGAKPRFSWAKAISR